MTHPPTPREKVELKPCPFCGGEAVAGSNFDNDHYVMCGADCDRCGGMVGYMKTEMAAIENWNRRTALASGSGDHAELARLAEAAEHDPEYDGRSFEAAANPATVLAILAEIAGLRESISRHDRQVSGMLRARLAAENRATEAERKLAEAVGIVRLLFEAFPKTKPRESDETEPFALRAARTFLSKEAERG